VTAVPARDRDTAGYRFVGDAVLEPHHDELRHDDGGRWNDGRFIIEPAWAPCRRLSTIIRERVGVGKNLPIG